MSSEPNSINFSAIEDKIYEATKLRSAHHRPGMDWLNPVEEVNQVITPSHDGLLVGPADHYNVGNLLRPHILTRVINFSKFRCAGLVSRDLTPLGGHPIRNYGESALEMSSSQLNLVHFGGEILTQNLLSGYEEAISENDRDRLESLQEISGGEQVTEFIRKRTGQLDDLAYVLAGEGEFHGSPISFHAISLSNPSDLPEERRNRMFSLLRGAAFVGIRDETGANYLEEEGIEVTRMPCALSVLPQVGARQLRECRDERALEEMRSRFPNGWIAIEISGIQEEEESKLKAALATIAERERLGLVFFHALSDTPVAECHELRRWVESFPEWSAAAFPSKKIWEVASFLLHSRLYCGSDLDSRMICMSGGVARISLPDRTSSTQSYCELWEHDDVPIEFDEEEDWSEALLEALNVDLSTLQQHANQLHAQYFSALEKFCDATGLNPRLIPAKGQTAHERASHQLHHLHDEWLTDEEGIRAFRKLNRRSAGSKMRGFVRNAIGRDRLRKTAQKG